MVQRFCELEMTLVLISTHDSEGLLMMSLRRHPNELAQQVLDVADVVTDALILTAGGITVGGERAEHWIRSGLVEARMLPKSRDALLDGATIRAARGVAPVQYRRRVKASS
jgi:hypothetical protein